MGFNIDITDAQLDKIGNYTDKFLKGGVLFASIMGMAGFLGLIFVTISPAPLSPEHVHEADPTAVGDLAPIAPDTPAAWITEFSDVPGSQTGECFETRTGIYAVCVPSLSGTALMVYQSPLSGDMWPTWKCEPCDGAGMCDGAKCPTAPVFECNATVLAEGCACSPGCVCGEHARKCEAQPPTKKTEVARVADLSGETKFFSVLSNAGYLFFMLLILLAELDIERFKHVFKFAAYWPARVLFQLFSGAQLINASTTLEIGGYVGCTFVTLPDCLFFCSHPLFSPCLFFPCVTKKQQRISNKQAWQRLCALPVSGQRVAACVRVAGVGFVQSVLLAILEGLQGTMTTSRPQQASCLAHTHTHTHTHTALRPVPHGGSACNLYHRHFLRHCR